MAELYQLLPGGGVGSPSLDSGETSSDVQQFQQTSTDGGDNDAPSISSIPSLSDGAHMCGAVDPTQPHITCEAVVSQQPDIEVAVSEKRQIPSSFTILDWWWEMFSWMIGTVSLLALILLVAILRDKPFTAWHSRLSVNTIVSALAQMAQSSLAVSLASGISQLKWDWLRSPREKKDIETFDLASRGPLGSFYFIWDQAFRHRKLHLTLLGASTTVLLIAFSTFAQQAIVIGERQTQSIGGAKIARATNFSLTWNKYLGNILTAGPEIVHGAKEGFFRDAIRVSDVQGYCPGDSCLWESYTSLGICTSTHQPTAAVEFSCKSNGTACLVVSSVDAAYNTTHLETIAQDMYSNALLFRTWFPGLGSHSYADQLDSSDVYFSILPKPEAQQSVWGRPIKFLKITFELCVHTYRSTIQRQQTYTQLLRQGPALRRDPDWQWTSAEGGLAYRYCGTAEGLSACLSDDVNAGDSGFLLNYLLVVFSGHITHNQTTLGDNDIIKLLYDEFNQTNGSEKLEARMKNVAISYTNGMRLSPHSAELIDGVVETTERYFHVEIPWLIMPVMLWLCASIFLLSTVLLTKRRSVPVWKASPLILLDCKWPAVNIDSDRLVRKRSKQLPTMVALEQNKFGWKLNEMDPGEN